MARTLMSAAVWLSGDPALGDCDLAARRRASARGCVEGAVEVAFLDAVMVDEDDVADSHSRERLGDDAADAAEPDDADPVAGQVGLGAAAPDADGRLLAGRSDGSGRRSGWKLRASWAAPTTRTVAASILS